MFEVELAVVVVPVQEAEMVQVPALFTAYWSVKLPVLVEFTV